ncbi:T9SS type A sorting domain-containing protein [Tamlana sp. 62-3]|uniref:T9SS type A sorting domain-containing protein n=1 Tax=Neotamlana sargassicola TaxID=2883125 RepID=A0A9X1L6X0_9FLAO|nr:T9SS type A sorting domain-containing protein [Tamlana sargassicola]MCB4807979.1 T9SS type A sorting domain-containing protein [Tamlana sargassicola]
MKKLLLFFVLISGSLFAQEQPFNCDYNAYLFQYNDVYAIDLASGNSYAVATDVTPGNINAAAYNPADGYIWGSLSTPEKSIVRIGKNFQTTTFYIDELPTKNRYVGDISATGIYYLKPGGTTYYAVDVNPESANYGKYLSSHNLDININVHDWAFNAVDGFLYTVEKTTNILYRINAQTGLVQNLGVVPILSGLNYTYGAVYFDASGRFYVSANQTGTIYVIQSVQDLNGINVIESNLFAFGPSSASNDGARCPTAPVPQEDCTNGIDDDGDGLVDCEDPSCSGYASCPVLEISSTSGSNEGGLESNNRLAMQISKRNFNRARRGYKFNKLTAKKLQKTSKYGKGSTAKGNGENLSLSDFVPLGVISEDEALEASPTDLIGITNAVDVYSVDYQKNDKTVASILLLETENGVYEHTKYICDRLLGAEIISVSTIEIKEQSFIKTLIRNTEGALEFVLSLSAKPVNGDANFEVESHWTLDKYEDNVGFYNFQIWSNSLDDLLMLGEEVLNLLEVQKPIVGYNNSTPPTVFVRKGKYRNGKLDLQIVNTNRTEAVNFDGGVRTTETETVENVSSSIDLTGSYITSIEVDAGNLFDIGFRIGDGIATPDDLFLSDGPWGYDDAATGTEVLFYNVQENDEVINENSFAVERNISLQAEIDDYVAVYRALTPKFNAVDLLEYDTFNFTAKGTGNLIIRLVKESITNWGEQYKTTIALSDNFQEFSVSFDDFKNLNGESIEASDVTSIVFTMLSENGTVETKSLDLKQVSFSSASNSLSVNDVTSENGLTAYPNPFKSTTVIKLESVATDVSIQVYDMLGREVDAQVISVNGNEAIYKAPNLSKGIYKFKLIDSNKKVYSGTFMKE